MTQFSDIVTEVYNVTKRSDLVNETQQAIVRAIIKEHAAYDYPDDLVVSNVVSLTPSTTPDNFRYAVSLQSTGINLYPSVRKIKWIREALNVIGQANYTSQGYFGELQFEEVSPSNIFDAYGLERYNYWYRIGQTINIVAQRTVANVILGYYNTPNLSVPANYGVTYTDWLADEYPYVIYDHAAMDIFRIIGKDSEMKVFQQKVMDNRFDVIKAKIGAI